MNTSLAEHVMDFSTLNAMREGYRLDLDDLFIQAGGDPNATIVVPLVSEQSPRVGAFVPMSQMDPVHFEQLLKSLEASLQRK